MTSPYLPYSHHKSSFEINYFLILVSFVLCPFGLNMGGILNITCAHLCHHSNGFPTHPSIIPLLGPLQLMKSLLESMFRFYFDNFGHGVESKLSTSLEFNS